MLALSRCSSVMLGRADPPAATEGVELRYQQLAYSSCLNIQLSSLKKSVSTRCLSKIESV